MGVFFRGVGPRALSNGLNSAIFYCWFEILRAHLAEAMARKQREQQLLQRQQQQAGGVGRHGATGQVRSAPAAGYDASGLGVYESVIV